MGYVTAAGDVLASLRTARGWSQDKLAEEAKVGPRTVQRAERGQRLRSERLARIAEALAVPPHHLHRGHFDVLGALAVARENACQHCGAQLARRVQVEHEYGDDDLDMYECGAMTGHRDCPCPKDPRFPSFEDYELRTRKDGDRYYTHAFGKTAMAKAVGLPNASGATRASSRRWLQREFIALRDGSAAAEQFMPFHEHD